MPVGKSFFLLHDKLIFNNDTKMCTDRIQNDYPFKHPIITDNRYYFLFFTRFPFYPIFFHLLRSSMVPIWLTAIFCIFKISFLAQFDTFFRFFSRKWVAFCYFSYQENVEFAICYFCSPDDKYRHIYL